VNSVASGERAGDVIGRYTLVEVLGEGGFGTVWRAQQSEPVKREVALKLLKLGMDTRQVVQRFEAERQALALMDHPNIAKVFDGGATENGRPYFAMELVAGEPITRYCDAHALGVEQRLELFRTVCLALHHAHTKGVIHRDIKPSNVLVSTSDGRALAKVIDFGIAKATGVELTEQSMRTDFDQIIGTPEYMAPEQTSFGAVDVDTRADVYSLGVLLYELLTRTKPFDLRTVLTKGYDELLRTIREVVPAKPSTRVVTRIESASAAPAKDESDSRVLGARLRGDLDWIVLKAIEKDRERRYQSAAELAADVEAHLADRPVSATPPSRRYLLAKFVRRHRGEVAAAAAALVLLVLGVVGTSAGLVWALDEKERADDALADAEAARASESAARTTAERELARASEIKRVVTGMLASVRPELAQGRDTELLEAILADTSRALLSGEIADPSVAAELDHLVGGAYHGLGLAALARPHLERARVYFATAADVPVVTRIAVERMLAAVTLLEGDIPGAVSAYEAVLAQAREAIGPHSVEALTLTIDAAHAHALAYHFDTALALLDGFFAALDAQAVDAQSGAAVPAVDIYVVDSATAQRAEALVALDRSQEAREILEALIERVEKERGEFDPVVLKALGTLVNANLVLGRRARAGVLARERLERCEEALGERHPLTYDARGGLAIVHLQTGRMDEAIPLLQGVVALGDELFGAQHPDVLEKRKSLGLALGAEGRFDEAWPVIEAAVAGYEARLGAAHPLTAEVQFVRLAIASDSGDEARYFALLERDLPNLTTVLGPVDGKVVEQRLRFASLLYARGRADDAQAEYAALVAAQRAAFGAEDGRVLDTINSIASTEFTAGRYDAARARYAELLPIAERVLGADDRLTLGVTTNLGLVEFELGALDQSREHLERSFAAKLRVLGRDDPWTSTAYDALCDVYRALGLEAELSALESTWTDGAR
jgi:tetratricopeptide (TPR) repeat protein